MKKLLLLSLLLAIVLPASAVTWTMNRLLTGTNLQIAASVTNNYGDTNVMYVKYPGLQTYLLPTNGSNSVVQGQAAPYVLSFTTTNIAPYAASNGIIVTNYVTQNTNSPIAANAFTDAGLWADVNGDASSVWFTAVISPTNNINVAYSNTLYFVLQTVNGGWSSSSNQMVFLAKVNSNTIPYIFTTNLTKAGFTDGSGAIRLQSVGVGVGTNLIVNDAFISGWKP